MSLHRNKINNRLRTILLSLASVFGVALIITPASAATEIASLNEGALAIITLVGVLLFAIVFEVWRSIKRRHVPVRNRATHDWSPKKRY